MLQAVNLERKFPGATARLRPDLGCRQPPAVNLAPLSNPRGLFFSSTRCSAPATELVKPATAVAPKRVGPSVRTADK